MVVTVTLNPCIDRTVILPSFTYGSMNRMKETTRDASGKGINVSLALQALGEESKALGFLYRENSELFLSSLKGKGLEYSAVENSGSLRENIKLFDEKTGVTTEINQKGDYVTQDKWEAFKTLYSSEIINTDAVVISGSVPQGLSTSSYRTLLEIAAEKKVPTVLDAEGDLLALGLEASPFLIKPNLYEMKKTFGLDDLRIETIVRKAQEILMKWNVKYVIVSLSERGAVLVTKGRALYSPALDIDVKSTQGAGDNMVAGILKAYIGRRSDYDMLRYGVAAASGAIMKEGTTSIDIDTFNKLVEKVCIKEVKL